MTPHQWQQIDPKDRGNVWSLLSETDRAAILASEREPPQTATLPREARVVIPQSEVVRRLRDKTAYPAARTMARIAAVAGWISGLVYFGIGLTHLAAATAEAAAAWLSFAIAISSVLTGALAHGAMQALADIADCAVQREVRSLEERNNR